MWGGQVEDALSRSRQMPIHALEFLQVMAEMETRVDHRAGNRHGIIFEAQCCCLLG